MTVVPVDGPASVRIELEVGKLDVVATDRPDVTITASASNPGRGGDRAAADAVRVDRVGDEIVVRGPQKRRLLGPGKDAVDLVVELPEASAVTALVRYGSARLAGRFGAVSVELPFGQLSLDTAERLELKGGHGDYRVTAVTGDADVRFKWGSTRVGHVGGRLQLSGDGPIMVDRTDGPADLKTSTGPLELGTAGAGATIRSAYGPVRVRDALRGVIRVDGAYGNVDVGVRAGTAVWLDATSQHGVVRTDLAADSGPGTGEETLELHVRTGYGSIAVHRSST